MAKSPGKPILTLIARVGLGSAERDFDLGAGRRIGLPLDPGTPQPRFFGAPAMRAEPLNIGGFTGRVTTGASCNVDVVTLVPHCNGTHTEGPGHIIEQPLPVQDCLPAGPVVARLVSVIPEADTDQHYPVQLTEEESLITTDVLGRCGSAGKEGFAVFAEQKKRSLSAVARGLWPRQEVAPDQSGPDTPPTALIIRTLPNDESKRQRDYCAEPHYPLLSTEAMRAIVAARVEHLLIDTPSVDRADDGGRLANHRLFWGMNESSTEPAPERRRCTVTELIYVPDDVPDGVYLLNLGVSPIVGDASPSAPVLYPEV